MDRWQPTGKSDTSGEQIINQTEVWRPSLQRVQGRALAYLRRKISVWIE
jgi:hypothetical protein